MNKRKLVEAILITVAYVLLFVAIEFKLSFLTLSNASLWFLIGGVLILYFQDDLAKKVPVPTISKAVVQTVGFIVLFIGFKSYVYTTVKSFWLAYLIIGALLYNYASQITTKFFGSEQN